MRLGAQATQHGPEAGGHKHDKQVCTKTDATCWEIQPEILTINFKNLELTLKIFLKIPSWTLNLSFLARDHDNCFGRVATPPTGVLRGIFATVSHSGILLNSLHKSSRSGTFTKIDSTKTSCVEKAVSAGIRKWKYFLFHIMRFRRFTILNIQAIETSLTSFMRCAIYHSQTAPMESHRSSVQRLSKCNKYLESDTRCGEAPCFMCFKRSWISSYTTRVFSFI